MANPKPTFDEALLRRMAHEIRTQDNRMTAEPVFCAQEICGFYDTDCERPIWQTEQSFFTAAGAEACIGPNTGHRSRVYVETGWHNPEWCAVRALLLALFPEEAAHGQG